MRLPPLLVITLAACAPSSYAAPPAPPAKAMALPALRTFQFTAKDRKVLPGDGVAADGACKEKVGEADQLGDLAVLAVFYQNACYTDGRYNAREFAVERGLVTASDGATYPAYRISPPAKAPAEFMGSHHVAYFRFAAAADQAVYTLEGESPALVGKLPAAKVTAGGWTRLPIDASALAQPITVFVAPGSAPVSALSPLGGAVQGAQLAATPLGTMALYRHATAGTPYDARQDATAGPDASMTRRQLFPVPLGQGALGVVWQDTADQRARITVISADQRTSRELVLANPRKDVLAAATSDGAATIYLFFVQPQDGRALTTRATRLVRFDLTTNQATEQAVDAGPKGLNITEFGHVASLAFDQHRLLLMIGRTLHRSPDGLNHQSGLAVEFDPQTLAVTHSYGQTSGHSFDNVLTSAAPGELLALDLGDNYPRGVHFHRFATVDGKPTWTDALVYSFKTQHGTTATAPDGRTHPPYPEISTGAHPFFKWSNDNGTYTELGGVMATPTGYTIVFAGEAMNGRALDNARAGISDPRNLAVVQLRRDFDTLPAFGSVVPDAAMLTKGPAESGGFYTFGGDWSAQRNTGVVWLTQYRTPDTNASHIRLAKLADGNALVLWETWTRSAYVTTYGMKLDPLGKVLTPAVNLGATVRLGHRDDVLVRGNDVYVVTGRAEAHALDVLVIRAK